MAYPHLFPTGFVEFQDSCSGPLLYRNQPSREANGVRLNQFMEKYVTGEYKDGDFIRMATNLKKTARTWNKMPKSIKNDFLKLILESNSSLGNDISKMYRPKKNVESFGDLDPNDYTKNVNGEEGAVEAVNNFIEEMKNKNSGFENVKAVSSDNRMSIFIIVVVSIVAVVIGFLVACSGNYVR